jgi:signal transduction histidine kinase
MNKSISQKFKINLIVLSIVITFIFFIINVSLYVINNNYLVNKVEEENNAFLQIMTHIINENDIDVALAYVEHYTHIHEVDIEVIDENKDVIFSSDVSHLYSSQYQITTEKGEFTVFIDNTESVTVSRIETNTFYVNGSLLIIYILAMIILIKINNTSANQINEDIENVLDLINETISKDKDFHHVEFYTIYRTINKYLEEIDLLTEQKEMNMKGLAHDIKTPLTIVYSFFERVLRGEDVSVEDKEIAFASSKKINELLNDIIENNKRVTNYKINIVDIIKEKINDYKSIFDNKKISIEFEDYDDVFVNWNQKDLSRVLDNIISNAYYYSKENSKFRIDIIVNNKVEINFTSCPININSLKVDTLFKKGYRGTNSNQYNSYGKGLGLYLSKILLRNINGDILATIEQGNVKFTIIL